MFFFCPESPSWLYLFKKDKEGARAALEKLRRNSDLSFELDEYHKQEVQMTSAAQVSVTDMFTSYRTRPLIVACIMHCSQQLSGVNAVIFYSTSIFRTAGLAHNDAQYATLSLGGIMILMTFVCMVLVDKLGRRTLHLSGLAGCMVSLISLTVFLTVEKENPGLTWSCLCIASVGVFIISFNVGPGSIPWFYTSELFEPNSARWAVSISIAVNWLCNFAVGVSFLHLQVSGINQSDISNTTYYTHYLLYTLLTIHTTYYTHYLLYTTYYIHYLL
ncbi:Glut1 [Bugula neritina]|uniref:Glut1 n=1 Tax=Bugula neritina TaxID=10212 RepID=A0A7J7IRK7_BUGNE|nr:Glut1 [Bugula neritina]